MAPDAEGLDRVLAGLARAALATHSEAYLVGGFVRDQLLGRAGKDIDVVTVGGDGLPLLNALANEFGWSPPQVFERFGTAQVRGGEYIVEVVRARAESYDPESRKPDVSPGTLREDIMRRDFTVNALARPVAGGDVIDLTGNGLDDLRRGILRTPLDPAETFSEDPLRLFRAARFCGQLGFELAPGVIDAMRQVAARSRILSVERIAEELRRLLVTSAPDRGLRVLRDAGLLDAVLPEFAATVGVEQGGWHLYDVFEHTVHAVAETPPRLTPRLGALFHDIGKPATHAVTEDGRHTFYGHPEVGATLTRSVLNRLRFSHEEIEATATLVELHMRPIQYDPVKFSNSAVRRLILAAGELRADMMDIALADTRASAFPTVEALEQLAARMDALDTGASLSRLKPPLDGRTIMELAGGRGPGRWIGAVHSALIEAVMEGEFEAGDTAAATTWLRQHPDLLQP